MNSPAEIAGHVLTWTNVLKELAGLAKSVKDLGSKPVSKEEATTLTQRIIELQGMIVTLQSDFLQLAQTNHELEMRISRQDRWEDEARNYRLEDIHGGVTVYVYRPTSASAEAPHWLCPGCFSNQKKGIFVMTTEPMYIRKTYKCSLCSLPIQVSVVPGEERPRQNG